MQHLHFVQDFLKTQQPYLTPLSKPFLQQITALNLKQIITNPKINTITGSAINIGLIWRPIGWLLPKLSIEGYCDYGVGVGVGIGVGVGVGAGVGVAEIIDP